MKQIVAKKITRENFLKYGEVMNLLDDEEMAKKSVRGAGGFKPDLMTLNFGGDTLPTVCVATVKKQDKFVIGFVENHVHTCEGVMALDNDVIIYAGVPSRSMDGSLKCDNLEAFILPVGTFVRYDPYVIHGTQYVIDAPEAHVLVMLPQRTFNNDMHAGRLDDDEKVEIVLE